MDSSALSQAIWASQRAAQDIPAWLLAPVVGLWDQASCEAVALAEGVEGIEVASPEVEDGRVILYLHGGAHHVFSVWTHRRIIGRISTALKARVVAVNYRKAPSYPFPAALEDTLAGWRWVSERSPDTPVALLGDSAGANLAFALMVRLAQLGERQPVACASMSPWLLLDQDLIDQRRSERAESAECAEPPADESLFEKVWHWGSSGCMERYLAGHDAKDPLISPLLAEPELVAKFPPVLIHASEGEVLRRDAEEMARKCTAAGVPTQLKLYAGCLHVPHANPFSDVFDDSFELMGRFFEKYWS